MDVPGLSELCAKLPPDAADKLMQRIGALFTEAGASAAGRLSDTRFGAVTPEKRGPLGMANLVKTAIAEGGGGAATVKETQVSLSAPDLSEAQRLLAVRYTIDQFSAKGRVAGDGDIANAFTDMLEDTQRRIFTMTKVVGEGAFEVAYQPIVNLTTPQDFALRGAGALLQSRRDRRDHQIHGIARHLRRFRPGAGEQKFFPWSAATIAVMLRSHSTFPAPPFPRPPVSACWRRC